MKFNYRANFLQKIPAVIAKTTTANQQIFIKVSFCLLTSTNVVEKENDLISN